MMLDAGFLIAVEQHDHRTQAVRLSAQRRGRTWSTPISCLRRTGSFSTF